MGITGRASLALMILSASSSAVEHSSFPCNTVDQCKAAELWHIPGPNPIVSPWNPDGKAAWMSTECEVAGGVQKVNETYVFVYHCLGTAGYRVGMSTSPTPMGPWTKPPIEPNLDVTAGGWDKDVVASFNILPDPEHPGHWLGYFEGGMPPSGKEDWSMGVARAPSPLGPWTKDPNNPVLDGNRTCDPNREFVGKCGGLYVASVLHGPHTNGEYWVYMEAPINENDEGPLALWTAKKPDGPFAFKAYVLDGGKHPGEWDYGRYSESRVWYYNGLFHLFATGSPVGGAHENKLNEQIGWAVSENGVNFTECTLRETLVRKHTKNHFQCCTCLTVACYVLYWMYRYPHNPIGPWTETTPHTVAMSEGHVWFEEASGDTSAMIYVYHTIRWVTNDNNSFAPDSRNNEDLGVELFSVSPKFKSPLLPLITENWQLDLKPGGISPCLYDWKNYQYCAQIKTVIRSSATDKVIYPTLSFAVNASCSNADKKIGAAGLSLQVFPFSNSSMTVGEQLTSVPIDGACVRGTYFGKGSLGTDGSMPPWVVTKLRNGGKGSLTGVTLGVVYNTDGTLH